MKKNLILLATACLGMTFLSTSCGQKDDSIVINFWNTFSETTNNRIQGIANKFAKDILEKEGVKIRFAVDKAGKYEDIEYKITEGYSSSNFPTLTVAYPDHVANYIAMSEGSANIVVNLEDLINDPEIGLDKEEWICDKGKEDIVPSFYEEGTQYAIEGTYSFPFMKSTELLTYNKQMVADVLDLLGMEGVDPDDYMADITWEELIELAECIDANRETFDLVNVPGQKKKYPIFYDSDANMFITQSYQRNIPYLSKDAQGHGCADFNNEQSLDLLVELQDLHHRDLLTTRNIYGTYGSNAFVTRESCFVIGSTAGANHNDPFAQKFEAGICKVPTLSTVPEERQKYISQGVTLALLRHPGDDKEIDDIRVKYGWKFMKFLTNTQNSILLCTDSNGYVPARISSYSDPDYSALINLNTHNSKNCKTVIEEVNGNYFNYPVFKGSAKARTEIQKAVTTALQLKGENGSRQKLQGLLATALNNTTGAM